MEPNLWLNKNLIEIQPIPLELSMAQLSPNLLTFFFNFDAFLHTLQRLVVTIAVTNVQKLNVRNLIGFVIGKKINVYVNQVK